MFTSGAKPNNHIFEWINIRETAEKESIFIFFWSIDAWEKKEKAIFPWRTLKLDLDKRVEWRDTVLLEVQPHVQRS